ncbi:hypothetical protein F4780DRAFT_793715 [Xylariomycetidae sp. FL0641]|nr:hypothetical protein F4780DRAFT_793715 [Xylariomycetidae sp. FL0641]
MTKPQSNLSQLKDFLAYLATVKGDLSNITAPPFVLSPKSVTEIPASWAERHSLFLAPAHEADPARRALLVLKNFLCSLKRQVYTASSEDGDDDDDDGGARKPLNAFLGELFLGSFAGGEGEGNDAGETRLITEQVSHHPPVTACHLYNRAHGVSSAGYVAQETSFSATAGVRVRQVGHALIRDEAHRESHLMTLPTLAVKGLLAGRPYPELEGTCYIASSAGFLATVAFAGKGALPGTGARNRVRATLANVREEGGGVGGGVVCEITGQWSGRLVVRDGETGATVEEFDVDEVPLAALRVAPPPRQSPWESRRAWQGVRRGLAAGDMARIAAEKDALEAAQRELRAAEAAAGVEWPRLFFRRVDDDPEFRLLAQIIPDAAARELGQERTAGVWKPVGVDAAEAIIEQGVFHRALEPTGQVGVE